jgi:hypothetical protein
MLHIVKQLYALFASCQGEMIPGTRFPELPGVCFEVRWIQRRPLDYIVVAVTLGVHEVIFMCYPLRGIVTYPPASPRPESWAGFSVQAERP